LRQSSHAVFVQQGLSALSPRSAAAVDHRGSADETLFVRRTKGWDLEKTPKYLLIRGPYTFSRNPSYLSLLMVLLGWMLFYGSFAILVAIVVVWALLNHVVVPMEERDLEARFGGVYRHYRNKVRRWLGKARA
jgi:protein-S-isoprenylcysteine O-methyltransferase Ste14